VADLAALYRESRQRVGTLLLSVDDAAPLDVPATPAWNAHEVLAHLAGVAEDFASGNTDGAPGEAWTAAQVERGRDRSVDALLRDWSEHGAALEAFLSSPAGKQGLAAVVDVVTHELDLRHAMGREPDVDAAFLDWAAPMLLRGFHHVVADRPPITVRAEPFEIVRSRLGRRTPAEVAAYDWSDDPAPYLDAWFLFGPRDEPLGERSL
jgi:uncharacterized protein (TIGR03083 family)